MRAYYGGYCEMNLAKADQLFAGDHVQMDVSAVVLFFGCWMEKCRLAGDSLRTRWPRSVFSNEIDAVAA